jgi:hypothetical protein
VGFHVALPFWVFVYMIWFGGSHLLVAGAIALLFVGVIVGVYGQLIQVPWPDPILLMLFRHFLSQ